ARSWRGDRRAGRRDPWHRERGRGSAAGAGRRDAASAARMSESPRPRAEGRDEARTPARPLCVSLMITCLADMFYPEVGVRIVRLLRRLGAQVEVPADQTCCGLPLFNSGYHDEAARVARRTVAAFKEAQHVVVPSGSCAWMVKHEYPGLMHD